MALPDHDNKMARFRRVLAAIPRSRLIAAASVASVVIGVIGIGLPLLVAFTARDSGLGTVQVQGSDGGGLEAGGPKIEPVAAGLSPSILGASVDYTYQGGQSIQLGTAPNFAVPVSAPWEQLWAAMTPDECGGATSDAQFDWLVKYGTPIPDHSVTASITNTATSGSEITVSEIRAQGELTPPAEDTVVVSPSNGGCGQGPGSAEVYAHLVIGVDPVAVYDVCYDGWCGNGMDTDPTPGEPVVFTARPGETRTLLLGYEQTVDFRGRFVATVTVDGASSVIDLSPGAADVVSPTVTLPTFVLNIGGSQDFTFCTSEWILDENGRWPNEMPNCTLDFWLTVLSGRSS